MDAPPVLTNLATLADPLRVRLLVVLERHELAVSELCEVLQLPQSTVSRHLKTLADDGWVSSRREGTSRLYSLAEEGRSPTSRQIWRLVRAQVAATPAAQQDVRRLGSVLAARRDTSQRFLLERRRAVGSPARRSLRLGVPGAEPASRCSIPRSSSPISAAAQGATAELLAPHVARRHRHRRLRGDAATPRARGSRRSPTRASKPARSRRCRSDDASVDAACLTLVLHHVSDPGARPRRSRARAQARRPAGRDRHAAARSRGVPPADGPRVARLLRGPGRALHQRGGRLSSTARRRARARARAKGPGLFIAVAARPRPVSSVAPDHRRGRRSQRRVSFHCVLEGAFRMSAVVSDVHAYQAAKQAGREPFKVADLSLAEFGRKEIRLAEHEMPGLMAAARALRGQEAARRRPHHGQPAHDGADRGAHRNARRARRRRALGVVQHLLDAGSRGRGRRRRPSRDGRHGERARRASRSSRGRARRSRSTGGARCRRWSGRTAAARR